MTNRTTVTVDPLILNEAKEKAKKNGESLKDFLSRAIVNQLEKEEVFDTRYALNETESEHID